MLVNNAGALASDYFKKSESRGRIINFISYYVTRATKYCVEDVESDAVAQHELAQISSSIWTFVGPHEALDRRAAADYVPALHRIYADHWLARGLRELEVTFATTTDMYARLEEHGRQFDRHLGRLKRLRNAAIHGGPVSEAGCQSVAGFAFRLGHQCLNQAMRALFTGNDIPSYMNNFRDDQIERYERIRTTGDIDALFLPAEIEPG